MKPQRLAAGTLPKALVSSHSGCENQAASTRVWRTSCGRKPFPREDHIMKWSCMVASAALVCLALAPPSMAQTEKDALALVSDDALGFIVLNRLGETNDKLGALVKRMQFPLPLKPLDLVKLVTGVQKGLDEKGSVIGVAYDGPGEGSEPSGVLFIPVSDYKEFIGQLQPKDATAEVTE